MYELQRLKSAIVDIEKYLTSIKSFGVQTVKDLEDEKTRHATAMLLFAIMNRMSDMGSEILSVEKVGAPTRYLDVMPMLAKANIINTEQAETLNKFIKERNKIAHFYGDVSPSDILVLLKKLPLVEQFLATVKKRIQKAEQEEDVSAE